MGVVGGDAEVGVDPMGFYPLAHAFAYHTATAEMVDMGTLPPLGHGPWVLTSQANGVNDSGLVVGEGRFDTEDPTKCHAFVASVSTPGTMTDIGTLPGGVNSRAMAVNNAGVVVGFSETSNVKRAFRWTEDRGMMELGDPPGWLASEAYAVSDTGIVAGQACLSFNPLTWHAAVWDGDQRIDLGTLGGWGSRATGVNSSGMVTGESIIGDAVHAFLWTANDGMVDLGLPAGFTGTIGTGINDAGMVVAWGQGPGITAHALLWAGGAWTDLHATYFPNWVFSYATCINDHGWIAGYGLNPSYQVRAWILVPEPAALGLLALSLLAVRPRRCAVAAVVSH